MNCPCGTLEEFSNCCQPFIEGSALPQTAEQLMRSRYTAHVMQNIDYIRETTAPEKRAQFNDEKVTEWAKSEWLGLSVLKAEGKVVEFMAKYKAGGHTYDHHEVSKFRQIGERWFYVEGDSHVHEEGDDHHHHHHGHSHTPVQRQAPKVGRNDPCVCGSGKKFKKCCAVA